MIVAPRVRENFRSLLLACLLLFAAIGLDVAAAATPPSSHPTTQSVEDEVLANILAQRIGERTVGDDSLPEAFLHRVADRIIRSTYQQRFRIVTDDRGGDAMQPGSAPAESVAVVGTLTVTQQRVAPDALKQWRFFREARPPARGFRAPLNLPEGHTAGITCPPFDSPGAGVSAEVREASRLIAQRLTRDGIIRTTAYAIDALGADRAARDPSGVLEDLCRAGLPIDLLACFEVNAKSEWSLAQIVQWFAGRLVSGETPEQIGFSQAIRFHFRPTLKGFQGLSDAGDTSFKTLHLQLTRGDYWIGEGDGGSTDVARQLIQALPEAEFLISIEQRFLGKMATTARGWPGVGRLRVVAVPLTVSQWARDNAVVGAIGVKSDASRSFAALVPRFASRGEDGSIFVPGDSLLMEGVAAAGRRVVQSPLLFQGGNLIAFRNPMNGRRTVLVGEAEVYRNVGLGLSREQVLEAFRLEFGVEHCVVLPAASYHIDYEVSVRVVGDRVVAFVNDTPAAARALFLCGLEALVRAKIVSPTDADTARRSLTAGRIQECLELAAAPVFRRADALGRFPFSLAEVFSTSRVDSPVGNLRRFLVACDLLAVEAMGDRTGETDRHTAAYLRSLSRREADRIQLRGKLSECGLRVVAVPSLADEEQSVNYLNGLHDRACYLMPAYGGLFAPLDRTARETLEREFGGTARIIAIGCAESQRRDGAIRCSVGVYAQP